MGNVSKSYAFDFLCLNDTIKLAKLFAIPRAEADQIDVDLSFELWAESWNQGAFFAFMDMLASDIEKTLDFAVTENIPHDTKYVEFAPKTDEPAAPEEAPAPITE